MTVRYPIAQSLGRHLVSGRKAKGLSQRDLAQRVQRNPNRVSELEADLLKGRSHRDRLSLLIDLCDALDMVPMLVPRARAREIEGLLGHGRTDASAAAAPARSVFDEMFVDLGGDEEE